MNLTWFQAAFAFKLVQLAALQLDANMRVTQSEYPHRFLAAVQLALAFMIQLQWWDPDAKTMTKTFDTEVGLSMYITYTS